MWAVDQVYSYSDIHPNTTTDTHIVLCIMMEESSPHVDLEIKLCLFPQQKVAQPGRGQAEDRMQE